jgi:restriction endonuclease Mrr
MDERTVINKILNKSSGIKAIVGEEMSEQLRWLDINHVDMDKVLYQLPKDAKVLTDGEVQLILQYIKPLYETWSLTDDEVHELLYSDDTQYLRDRILTHARDVYDALGINE